MRRTAVTQTDRDGVDVTNDVTVGQQLRLLALMRSPHDLPNAVALHRLRGEAEVGDGVHQHEVLAEQPLHQAVQEGPAELAAGGHRADLDVTWRQSKVSRTTLLLTFLARLSSQKISSKTSNN